MGRPTISPSYHLAVSPSYPPTLLPSPSGRQEEPRARTSGHHEPEEPSSSTKKRGRGVREPLCLRCVPFRRVCRCLSLSVCLSLPSVLERRSVCLSVSV